VKTEPTHVCDPATAGWHAPERGSRESGSRTTSSTVSPSILMTNTLTVTGTALKSSAVTISPMTLASGESRRGDHPDHARIVVPPSFSTPPIESQTNGHAGGVLQPEPAKMRIRTVDSVKES